MSSPPQPLRLTQEFVTSAKALSNAHDQIERCLNHGISLSESVQGRTYEIAFRAPVTGPIRIMTGLSTAPLAVLLLGLWRTSPVFDSVGVASTLRWTFDKGDVILPVFSGIPGNDSYLVRVLAWEV